MCEQTKKSNSHLSLPLTNNDKIQNDLLVRAMNYHGQQLTSMIKDDPIFTELDVRKVDYHLYHNRSQDELCMEDRGNRLRLIRFIAANINPLFAEQQQNKTTALTEGGSMNAASVAG